jgi:hypothetical protein
MARARLMRRPATRLERAGCETRPANKEVAASLVLHTVTNTTRVFIRDHPEQVDCGEFARELSTMIRRYLATGDEA